MKKLALWLLALALPVGAQTFHYPAVESNNTWAGTNIFNSTTTFNGTLNITNPLGANLTAPKLFQLSDPAGGAANALQAATQHYVDTSLELNMKAFGCDPANADNSPCFDTTLAKNLSFNEYFLPPGTYNTSSCTPFQNLASHFGIHGAAWAATTINYTGPASTTPPTNTTGWWTIGASTINANAPPHVGDSVLANQSLANLTFIGGIQTGTVVTSVTGTGAPYTVGISKPTTATNGSSGSPVPVNFGWQCIFDLGSDDINWFSVHDLGFSYSNLPQTATSGTTDYPATAILFNTSGLAINGIHDFNMYNLYFVNATRGIANTRSTVGTQGSFVWGGTFTNIVGAAGIAVGTVPNIQGTPASGMQGATINIGYNNGKGGGSTRLTFRQVYNRQTAMEPVMTVQRTAGLVLNNIESNNSQDVTYDFDNNTDMSANGSHIEFHTQITSGHAVIQTFSSSGQYNNVDIESHVCPITLPAGTCSTTPATPLMYGLNDNGSGVGTLSTDNWTLTPYSDSLGYCSVSGTWTAGLTALTLTPNACSGSITSNQSVVGQGIQPETVVTVGVGPTYTLSLPPTAPGSSTNLVFSTYTAYVANVGTGAIAPGSSIKGYRGFNGPLAPGSGSNNLLFSAGNLFHSSPGFVFTEPASSTSPGSFIYPSVSAVGTGSTTGLPAGNGCSVYMKYTGVGVFPASQYREIAICHDSGAGGLSGITVYSSDSAIRGSESFTKIFSCDKLGNCTAPTTLTTNGLNTIGNGSTGFVAYLKAATGSWSFLPDAIATVGVNINSPAIFWGARYQHAGGSATDLCSLTNTALSSTLADPNMALVLSCSGSPGTHIFNLSGLTPPATDNTNAVPTTAWVNTFVASTLGAQAAWFATGSPSSLAGQAFVANKVVYYDFNIPQAVLVSKITYKVMTFDNTANVYDMAVLTSNGSTILLSLAGLPGTTFAPAAGTGNCNSSSFCTQTFTSPATLAPGHYILAVTTNCAATCAVLAGSVAGVWESTASSSGVAATSAGLMTTFTPNAVSYNASAAWWGVTLHN